MFLPQDLTRHPEDGNGIGLWVSDLLAGAGLILLCVAAFFVLGVLFDKTEQHQQDRLPRYITTTTTTEN